MYSPDISQAQCRQVFEAGRLQWCMISFNWYIDSVEGWAYVHSDLVKPDLVEACCKTRQDKTRQDKTRQDKTRQDKTRVCCQVLTSPGEGT